MSVQKVLPPGSEWESNMAIVRTYVVVSFLLHKAIPIESESGSRAVN